MENSKKQSLVERYGKVNIIIALLCAFLLVINSVMVSESALNPIASNKNLAYMLNFLVGCEGKLGVIGSMSYAKAFGEGLLILLLLYWGLVWDYSYKRK